MKKEEIKKLKKIDLLEENNKHKKRAKIFLILSIILFAYIAWNFIENSLEKKDILTDELKCQIQLETYFQNQTNQSITEFKRELCEESTITQTIHAFFEHFLKLDRPWIIKFLIFLGVLYLIQITFALVMDIMEVIMLIFVIFKRIYKWIKSKFIKDEKEKEI